MLVGDLMGTVGVRATPRVRWCSRDAYCSRVARAGGSRSERGNIGMMPRWIPACAYPVACVPSLSRSVSGCCAMGLGPGVVVESVPRALERASVCGRAVAYVGVRLVDLRYTAKDAIILPYRFGGDHPGGTLNSHSHCAWRKPS